MLKMQSPLLLLAICAFAVSFASEMSTTEVNRQCPEMMCFMHCENGYVKDNNGCNTCQCKTEPQDSTTVKCPESMCFMYCQYGFQKDSSGCDTCKCNPKPKCPEVTCEIYCAHGFKKDRNGCAICQCRDRDQSYEVSTTKPSCPEIMCAMFCENGFKKDAKGCDICECKLPSRFECPEVMCADHCPYGYKKNPRGCSTCNCIEAPIAKPTCRRVMCRMYCRYGWQKDENGCDRCLCNKKPVTPAPKPCSRVMCMMYCRHGFEQDANGCNMCKCKRPLVEPTPMTKPKQCPPVSCRMYCRYGWQKDQNNCDICACKAKPVPAISHGSKIKQCPEFMCMMHCQLGYVKDTNGCDTCKCKKLPRENPANCSKTMCYMHCHLGFEKDTNGCDICKCKERIMPIGCPMYKCVPCKSGLYKFDKNGCQTCNCESPCSMMDCPDGMICTLKKNSEGEAICKPMPICHRRRALSHMKEQNINNLWPMMLHGAPEAVPYTMPPVLKCDKDGSFAPKQCDQSRCWCVDDRGVEYHSPGNLKSQDLNCDQKKTDVLNVGLNMTHELVDLEQHLAEFRRKVQKSISGWTSVEQKFIKDILVKPQTDSIVFVEFDLHYDGYTDLASTAVHLHIQIKKLYFTIHYQDATFRPIPETVTMHHYYQPTTGCVRPWRHRVTEWTQHHLPIVVGAAAVLLIVIIACVVAAVLIRKKRIQERQNADQGPKYKKIVRVNV